MKHEGFDKHEGSGNMSRNRSIAQRMGNELSGAKKGDPNYAKVLFTPDDMASFETLMSEVDDARGTSGKFMLPKRNTDDDPPSTGGCFRGWCSGVNFVLVVVLVVTAVVGYDFTTSYLSQTNANAAINVDNTLEQSTASSNAKFNSPAAKQAANALAADFAQARRGGTPGSSSSVGLEKDAEGRREFLKHTGAGVESVTVTTEADTGVMTSMDTSVVPDAFAIPEFKPKKNATSAGSAFSKNTAAREMGKNVSSGASLMDKQSTLSASSTWKSDATGFDGVDAWTPGTVLPNALDAVTTGSGTTKKVYPGATNDQAAASETSPAFDSTSRAVADAAESTAADAAEASFRVESDSPKESDLERRTRHDAEDAARRTRHEKEDAERTARHAMEDELRELRLRVKRQDDRGAVPGEWIDGNGYDTHDGIGDGSSGDFPPGNATAGFPPLDDPGSGGFPNRGRADLPKDVSVSIHAPPRIDDPLGLLSEDESGSNDSRNGNTGPPGAPSGADDRGDTNGTSTAGIVNTTVTVPTAENVEDVEDAENTGDTKEDETRDETSPAPAPAPAGRTPRRAAAEKGRGKKYGAAKASKRGNGTTTPGDVGASTDDEEPTKDAGEAPESDSPEETQEQFTKDASPGPETGFLQETKAEFGGDADAELATPAQSVSVDTSETDPTDDHAAAGSSSSEEFEKEDAMGNLLTDYDHGVLRVDSNVSRTGDARTGTGPGTKKENLDDVGKKEKPTTLKADPSEHKSDTKTVVKGLVIEHDDAKDTEDDPEAQAPEVGTFF